MQPLFLPPPLLLLTSHESRPPSGWCGKTDGRDEEVPLFARIRTEKEGEGFVRLKKGIFWRQQMADH